MTQQEQIDQILKSLQKLTATNETLVQEVAGLKKDNLELRKYAEDKSARVAANKVTFEELGQEMLDLLGKMGTVKETLLQDSVEEEYFSGGDLGEICRIANELHSGEDTHLSWRREGVKLEPEHAAPTAEPFTGTAKEERMDCYFSDDNNYSSVAMRRFAERYQTVRDMNVQLKIAGWDNSAFRAGKIVLCLKGDAFDYVKFAKSSNEEWANRDDKLLEKL